MLAIGLANKAPISRGAASLPIGAPPQTATICQIE